MRNSLRFVVGDRVVLRSHPGRDGDIVRMEGNTYLVDVHPGAVGGYAYITIPGTRYVNWPLNTFTDKELDYLDPKTKMTRIKKDGE